MPTIFSVCFAINELLSESRAESDIPIIVQYTGFGNTFYDSFSSREGFPHCSFKSELVHDFIEVFITYKAAMHSVAAAVDDLYCCSLRAVLVLLCLSLKDTLLLFIAFISFSFSLSTLIERGDRFLYLPLFYRV